MAPVKEFVGLIPPRDTRPKAAFFGKAMHFLRDQFTITTWLCLGAVVQGSLLLAAGPLALAPAAGYILYNVLNAYAMATGWRHNTYMDGIILKKFSAAFPNEEGKYGATPANSDVVVLLIGARCNHPLGAFAPGFNKLDGYFESMARDLETHAEEFGYLGMTSWVNSTDRQTGSEVMSVGYFKSVEALHAFAHSDFHTKAWQWWNGTLKEHSHLSIYHETYHVPKGHWEAIYANSHAGGICSTTTKFMNEVTGEEKWASPVVDASKGLLKTSAGRMNRSRGDEHEKFGTDPQYEY